jgi:hypothetical protein
MNIDLSAELHGVDLSDFDSELDRLSYLLDLATKIVEQADREVTRQIVLLGGDCRIDPDRFYEAVMRKITARRADVALGNAWLQLFRKGV